MPLKTISDLRSAIYTGTVYHRRFVGRDHTLRYQSFYLLLDLAELNALAAISKLFGVNRRRWFAFHEADHAEQPNVDDSRGAHDSPLTHQLSLLLTRNGIHDEQWRFQLLTMPRTLGYVFNPITVVYCYRLSGELAAMIYEVNNTFGERIHYVLPVGDAEQSIRHQCAKAMFVSPFFPLEGRYDFDLSRPNSKITLTIDYQRNDELQLRAAFTGTRYPFNRDTLRKLALTHSGTTYKTIAGIHYEAVKLWAKGLPLFGHTPPHASRTNTNEKRI